MVISVSQFNRICAIGSRWRLTTGVYVTITKRTWNDIEYQYDDTGAHAVTNIHSLFRHVDFSTFHETW